MPWSTPKTDFANGESLTAAQMNAIGTNLDFLYDNTGGYTTTATAAGTTTLTDASTVKQFFTGTTTQTVVLPVVSTLELGDQFEIYNNSTGALTVNSSGGNLVVTINAGHSYVLTCILTTGTTAASWDAEWQGSSTITGTGANVLTTNATLTNPALSYAIMKAPEENWTVSATAATGTINFDTMTQGALYYTSNATANFTLNFRGDGSNTLNNTLGTATSVTVVFLNTNGATAYYPTTFQIDGTAVTPRWQGGSAPTAGNANSIDAYTFSIIKTAASTYTVLAAQTRFA